MTNLNIIHLRNESYDLPHLIANIRHDLSTFGYVIVRDFYNGNRNAYQSFLEFCERLAKPMPHNKYGNVIWDIKPKADSVSQVATFSEHSEDAFLHTDSQYSASPEDFFALLCLRSARCGGGGSIALSLEHLLADLHTTVKGRACINILQNHKIRFIVPSIFNDSNKEIKYAEHYVLSQGTIRFRADTIETGFKLFPGYAAAEMIEAYFFLKAVIQRSKSLIRFNLNDNDALFINNTTMLHGRTKFVDNLRHLLRIRMKK